MVIWFQDTPASWTKKTINIVGREGMTIGDVDMDMHEDIVCNGHRGDLDSDGRNDVVAVEHSSMAQIHRSC